MPTFLLIARHDAADCAFYNEKSAKTLAAYASKLPELLAKHGIKIVGACTVNSEHLAVQILEAPSFEAMMAWGKEPENANMSNWQTTEFKIANTFEETAQMIQMVWQKK
ncbi:MAG TPA: hypothetical protein VEG65_07515 [Candidatus Bathyarchaeia archaeon]|nr:hypothetical protein [Candidatus Bathyarchaeia archaeon]